MVFPMHDWPTIDPVSATGLLEMFNQVGIGLLMGLTLQVCTAAMVLAGQALSNSIGLSFASMLDPNLGNVPVLAQFMVIVSTLIFISLGGHTLIIGLVMDSFNTLPIGKGLLTADAWAHFVIWSSMMFLGAVLLALPVMITMLFVNLGLGVATRAAPSLNIFSVGLPAMMIAGFLVFMVALPSMGGRIQWVWLQGFHEVRAQMGLG
jgi:flagellar biosynthetic protein FliR